MLDCKVICELRFSFRMVFGYPPIGEEIRKMIGPMFADNGGFSIALKKTLDDPGMN